MKNKTNKQTNKLTPQQISEKKFVDQYSGMSWYDEECASAALNIKGELGEKAKKFLKAREEFLNLLDEIGYEWG